MSKLNDLFFDYVQTAEYQSKYNESDGTITTGKAARNLFDNGYLPDEVGFYATEREELGFINGFRYAMQIMSECTQTKAVQ